MNWIKVNMVDCLAAGSGGDHRECFIDPEEVVGVAEIYDTNFEPNHHTDVRLRAGGGYKVMESIYDVMAQLKKARGQ